MSEEAAGAERSGDGAVQDEASAPRRVSLPVGIVVRRAPGATRWAKWSYRAVALIPGAAAADWRPLREEADGTAEFHAATATLELHRADAEGYAVSLAMTPPAVFVIARRGPQPGDRPTLFRVTASAYEAQDFADSGEDEVEPVAMPEGLHAFVEGFVTAHFVEEPFVKRRRDKVRVDRVEDGVGDSRIRQMADVYRAPAEQKTRRQGDRALPVRDGEREPGEGE
ncbi:hypothetical protein ATO13_18099 [Stappia sp. 22II-S9-Z10]|nr:hypothetical protein ATO13_18099 [Stappia sp. 22II-S9-Z10]